MKLFCKGESAKIVLDGINDKAVLIAAKDLQNNLRDMSGRSDGFHIGREVSKNAIIIRNVEQGEAESYIVKVEKDGVSISGSDILGTVYGIYAFATHCLGIDPMYHFTDLFPSVQEEFTLKEQVITSKKKRTRFRGWFINDEDLLSCFRPCGGQRAITYNQDFFKTVISPSVMAIILETALRLEMNMIIPSSFIDILNPAEEDIVRATTERGLYISQHHQEPVGVAYFAAENYINKHAPGRAVSYVKEPEIMEEIWRTYIQRWAKYGDKVIWQLGLRGKGDKAVWRTDAAASASSLQERGTVISNAIETQYRMIAETLGHHKFLSTSTLWMEGAKLYDQGYLKLPKGTIAVFSDIGHTQLFSRDLYQTRHIPGEKYGIYYHAGFFREGPHMAEGTDPEKMLYCYQDAEHYDALEYSILNVGNIRELCFSIKLNAEIVSCSPADFDLDNFRDREFGRIYGEMSEEVKKLDKMYYKSIGDLGSAYAKQYIDLTDFHYYEHGKVPFPSFPLTDGTLCTMGACWLHRLERVTTQVYTPDTENFKMIRTVLKNCEAQYSELLKQLQALEIQISTTEKTYYRFSQVFRCYYMLQLTRWLYALTNMLIGDKVEENRAVGVGALNAILDARREFSNEKWDGWYDGDYRLDIRELRNYTAGFGLFVKEGD
jgi:hypothetical protein